MRRNSETFQKYCILLILSFINATKVVLSDAFYVFKIREGNPLKKLFFVAELGRPYDFVNIFITTTPALYAKMNLGTFSVTTFAIIAIFENQHVFIIFIFGGSQ